MQTRKRNNELIINQRSNDFKEIENGKQVGFAFSKLLSIVKCAIVSWYFFACFFFLFFFSVRSRSNVSSHEKYLRLEQHTASSSSIRLTVLFFFLLFLFLRLSFLYSFAISPSILFQSHPLFFCSYSLYRLLICLSIGLLSPSSIIVLFFSISLSVFTASTFPIVGMPHFHHQPFCCFFSHYTKY